MAKKRERLEIVKDILKTISKNRKIKPTQLLHSSNLSPQMFKEYVGELIQKEFIEETEISKKKYFILKVKGQNFLREYITIESFIQNFGL